MPNDIATKTEGKSGIVCSACIVLYAVLTGGVVLQTTVVDPRTDAAEIFANFIGTAPVVNGPVTHLRVADNEFIREGQPLLEIDDRPYAYVLAQGESDLDSLHGQIENQRRTIASLANSVAVARSVNVSSEAGVNRAAAAVEQPSGIAL